MRLRERQIRDLAVMVVGDDEAFPYRSSMFITGFFQRSGFDHVHDGSTRWRWAAERLAELNLGPSPAPDLPSADLLQIISELLDIDDFERVNKQRQPALDRLNQVLGRQGLVAYLDASGTCHVRNNGTGASSSTVRLPSRPLSPEEIAQRQRVAAFLDSASEDELTDRLIVPLFQRLGFQRVTPAGHREKTLEFGKDLWMKLQLPTGHWIYFCAQIKRDKIDAAGKSASSNAAEVLTQAEMAMRHPILDPETNRKILLDHIFIISGGEITRAARTLIGEALDASQRRHIIFMDRDEFLNHSARILLDLRFDDTDPDDLPF